jgi:hypothetical protein
MGVPAHNQDKECVSFAPAQGLNDGRVNVVLIVIRRLLCELATVLLHGHRMRADGNIYWLSERRPVTWELGLG